MAPQGHRRQILLFLIAIILPCVVLVVLGLRMLAQDRELAEKRLADERRGVVTQLRQELAARLERLALEEATAFLADQDRAQRHDYRPPVVLVADVRDGQLTLPWERDPGPTRFRRLLSQQEFAGLVEQGERAEIVSRQVGTAVGRYTAALERAGHPAQVAYARLLRGRALLAARRRDEARRDYHAVLGSGLDVVDEHGVPLALYAATKILETGGPPGPVVERIRQTLSDGRWLSPPALYLLRALGASLAASEVSADVGIVRDLIAAIATRLALTEQAVALRRDLPGIGLATLGPRTHGAERRWVPYGNPPWLVGLTTALGTDHDVLVAVQAEVVFQAVTGAVPGAIEHAATLAVASGDDGRGDLLGTEFPGVVARFGSPAGTSQPDTNLRPWFYIVTLVLVVSVALFGAYLVSRDVRRELRLAEMRSRFVSGVSHELKTPLTAIRMFAETLQLGRSPDTAAQAEYLETIVNESERLTRLLNNVLDFSKIERGKKEYRYRLTDLADVVAASARAMRYPLEQLRFTLNVDVQADLPPVNVDRDAIEQAILNLLANAVKYSGDSRSIDLRLARADGEAVIEVVDRGVGIAAEEQSRVFEQFYRVSTKDNEGIPGTGLGLTLVRHIVEGHGGSVTVRSAPGQGSAFAIHLPLGNDVA